MRAPFFSSGFSWFAKTTLLFVVACVVTWLALPAPIDSNAWIPTPAAALEGALAINNALATAVPVAASLDAPEHAFLDGERVLTATATGDIVAIDRRSGAVTVLGNVGTHAFGLARSRLPGTENVLYVAAGERGLLAFDEHTKQTRVVLTEADGLPCKMINAVSVDGQGRVYMTDSSTSWSFDRYTEDVLEQKPTGRALQWDPSTNTTSVLLRGKSFANGIALSPDDTSLFVVETGRYTIWRVYLTGDKRNTAETLIHNLPGFPDNITVSPRGTLWVAVPGVRRRLLDAIHPRPLLKDLTAKMPAWLRPKMPTESMAIELSVPASGEGVPLRSLQNWQSATMVGPSVALEVDGFLWLGHFQTPGLDRVPL
jgi:sugar lactone lactonase YvrE